MSNLEKVLLSSEPKSGITSMVALSREPFVLELV